jgi:hypothetical protein
VLVIQQLNQQFCGSCHGCFLRLALWGDSQAADIEGFKKRKFDKNNKKHKISQTKVKMTPIVLVTRATL